MTFQKQKKEKKEPFRVVSQQTEGGKKGEFIGTRPAQGHPTHPKNNPERGFLGQKGDRKCARPETGCLWDH